ncbi:aspartate aminotransferase [Corynespora cassiicola Philippines]|uniref:Aspartate aminotransferase n=1 Tax=Corynespora cassiicola Philippines TaxID=1448308 RepID=A0A2T2NIM3_CORCC|nr:aspartate aminotransferase [Corynespora cassiicola Philippines]
MFRTVPAGPPDPVFILKNAADADLSNEKIDLGVGVYRNEEGNFHELEVIKKYEVTTGGPAFVERASHVLFGLDSLAIKSRRVTSVQAISGTGSIHLAALFLSRCAAFKDRKVYVGTPAWGNYEPLFNLVGLSVATYRHYDPASASVDFDILEKTASEAPEGSIFVLQGCCHNPSGADLTKEKWQTLARIMQERKLFPLFDMAYQGLGDSLADDAYGLRLFTEMNLELVACQSFSKNFGIYGERCGVLHVVSEAEAVAGNVYDQLRCLIRWEFSSSPAYGSRLVNIILGDEELRRQWADELEKMRQRLAQNRKLLYEALTPGKWTSILSSKGLFCFLPLRPEECASLQAHHHVYMLKSGRINVSGLNRTNIGRMASAIDQVVRERTTSRL